MRNRLFRQVKILCQLWIFFMAVVTNAGALVLGDIQVSSTLGQPLNARIAFVDLGDTDALKLKISLASMDEYQRFGLQYPEAAKINFQVVNEQGALLPFIRVSSPHPMEEPFVNLLLEVVSPSGKLIKAYTFLLDPVPEPPDLAAAATTVAPGHQVATRSSTSASPVKSARRKPRAKQVVRTEPVVGRSHLKLAMSLSISSYDPSAATLQNRDALQEELISKEKALQDLNQQIGEMQTVIRSLQSRQGLDAVSAVSPVPAVKAREQNPVVVTPPPAQPEKSPSAKSERLWLNSALGFAVALLGVSGFFLYRKYKQMHEWQQGPFDDLHEEVITEGAADESKAAIVLPVKLRSEAAEERGMVTAKEAPFTSQTESDLENAADEPPVPALQFEKVHIGVPSMQMPAEPIVPPEYALLMEANRYLRTGDDEKAEKVLQQAIALNSKNLYGYQALLRIHEKRGDAKAFENTALQMRPYLDDASFKEVAQTGHKLDPENPLYL